jgi:hypothetical protein
MQIDKLIDEYLVFQVEPDKDTQLVLKFIETNLKLLQWNDKTGMQILQERLNEDPPLDRVLQNQLDVMHRAYSDNLFDEVSNGNTQRLQQAFSELKDLLLNMNKDIPSELEQEMNVYDFEYICVFCDKLMHIIYTFDPKANSMKTWYERLKSYYVNNSVICQVKFITDFLPKVIQRLIDLNSHQLII